MQTHQLSSICVIILAFVHAQAWLQTKSLNGIDWKATYAGFGEATIIRASVPGSMYMDLYNQSIISDPYYKYRDTEYLKYGLMSWNYTKHFNYNPGMLVSNISVDLVCDGVDTFSKVYLNNQLIGETSNQFLQYRFPLKKALAVNNTVVFVFESAVERAKKLSDMSRDDIPPDCPPDVNHGVCHVNFIRKEQASFSWDWGPAFPTVGIWKDIRLESYTEPYMSNFSLEVRSADSKSWFITVRMYMVGLEQLQETMDYTMSAILLDPRITDEQTIRFSNTSNPRVIIVLTVPKEKVKLWWPNGYGEQPLYTVNASIYRKIPNWQSKKIGFRTVELVQEPYFKAKGLSFYFKINDMPIFMKGSNWIPADSFQSRVTYDRLRSILYSAKLANMNMLRVWGGGIYEQDDFYALCDEMGIMVWQDFMFACAMYPVDENFLRNVEAEVTQQVRRLKHHPSIAVWAGNNENEAALRDNWYNTSGRFDFFRKNYITLYIDTIQSALLAEDPYLIFVSSSPSNGAQSEKEGWIASNPYDTLYGDVHYYNYSAGRYYTDKHPRSRFLSEYGYQSWPKFDLLRNLTTEEDWFEFSKFSFNRNHHGLGQEQINSQISYYFNTPNATKDRASNFSHYIFLTQTNQAMYIRGVSEFARRSQSRLYGDEGITMGALYWQLNDIWPGPSWSSLEFDGSWKMLHYYARKFFAPRMLSMSVEFNNLTVYRVADNYTERGAEVLTLVCRSWDSFLQVSSIDIPVAAFSKTVSTVLYNADLDSTLSMLQCEDRRSRFLVAYHDNLETELALSPFKDIIGLRKRKPQISIDTTPNPLELAIVITNDCVVPFLWLSTTYDGYFSDNGFLLKDPYILITFTSLSGKIDPDSFQKSVTILSLMDLYEF